MRIKRELPVFLLSLLALAIGSLVTLVYEFVPLYICTDVGQVINYLRPFLNSLIFSFSPQCSYLKAAFPCVLFTALLALLYYFFRKGRKRSRLILYSASLVGNSLIGMFTMTWTYAHMFGLPISFYKNLTTLFTDNPSFPILTLSGTVSGILLAVSITFLLWIAEQVVSACVKKLRKSTLPTD